MKTIVIVEDDKFMREELALILKKEGYKVSCITSFENTGESIIMNHPDLVLLDINLPYSSGFEICRFIKEKSEIPVLILTSRDQLQDELHGLNLGADEFLTKPCHKERLLARINNLLKRYEVRENMISSYGLLLDHNTFTLYIGEKSVVLPQNQGIIMELLMKNSGKTVTKDMLFKALWGTTEFIDENALQVNMTRLKKTLRNLQVKPEILTVRGMGYKLIQGRDKENE